MQPGVGPGRAVGLAVTLAPMRLSLTVSIAWLGSSACASAPAEPSPLASAPLVASATPSASASTSAAPASVGVDAPIVGECRGDACWRSSSGFRFLHPSPRGHTLESVVATRPGEAYAVGAGETVLRLRRDEISRVIIPNVESPAKLLDAIAGGNSAEEMPGIELQRSRFESIVRPAPGELMVLLHGSGVGHYDGRAWAALRPPADQAFGDEMAGGEGGVWVTPDLVHSVMRVGELLRLEHGSFVARGEYPRKTVVRSMWAHDGNLWLGADEGLVLASKQGGPLTIEPLEPPAKSDVTAIWVSRDGERGVLQTRNDTIYERRKGGWEQAEDLASPAGERLYHIESFWEAPDGSEVWAAGSTLLRLRQGGRWQPVALPKLGRKNETFDLFEGARYHAVSGTSPEDVWAVGRSGLVMHFDGRSWSSHTRISTDASIREIVSLGGERWLTASEDGVTFEGEGATITSIKNQEPITGVDRVLRTDDGHVLLPHVDHMFEWRDGAVTIVPLRAPFHTKAARSLNELAWVGWEGKVERYESGRVVKLTGPKDDDFSKATFVGRDLWIVGESIARMQGGALRTLYRRDGDEIRGMAARGPKELFFLGSGEEGNFVLHWDGKSFQRQEVPQFHSLYALAVDAKGGLWAVGGHGALTHFDGTRWENLDSGTNEALHSVHVTPKGAVIASGDGGVIVARAAD